MNAVHVFGQFISIVILISIDVVENGGTLYIFPDPSTVINEFIVYKQLSKNIFQEQFAATLIGKKFNVKIYIYTINKQSKPSVSSEIPKKSGKSLQEKSTRSRYTLGTTKKKEVCPSQFCIVCHFALCGKK